MGTSVRHFQQVKDKIGGALMKAKDAKARAVETRFIPGWTRGLKGAWVQRLNLKHEEPLSKRCFHLQLAGAMHVKPGLKPRLVSALENNIR